MALFTFTSEATTERKNLENGRSVGVVKNLETKTSKSGRDMLVVTISVGGVELRQYFTDNPVSRRIFDSLQVSAGLEPSAEVDEDLLIGRKVGVMIGSQRDSEYKEIKFFLDDWSDLKQDDDDDDLDLDLEL